MQINLVSGWRRDLRMAIGAQFAIDGQRTVTGPNGPAWKSGGQGYFAGESAMRVESIETRSYRERAVSIANQLLALGKPEMIPRALAAAKAREKNLPADPSELHRAAMRYQAKMGAVGVKLSISEAVAHASRDVSAGPRNPTEVAHAALLRCAEMEKLGMPISYAEAVRDVSAR